MTVLNAKPSGKTAQGQALRKPHNVKVKDLKLVYVAGSINEYRLWNSEDNHPKDQREAAGHERANIINRLLEESA